MAIEQIAGSREAGCKLRALSSVAAPEAPCAIAEAVVPFGEARRMKTELISALTKVPRFRYQLETLQGWVLPQSGKKRRVRVETLVLSAEGDPEIETEAIYME